MNALTSSLKALIIALVLVGTVVPAAAQDTPVYDDGSVWAIDYVRTEPGQFDNYLENLSQAWKRVNDLAVERGYILSYHVLSGQPSDRDDWDLMLLVEYPNMAALDNAEERFGPLRDEVLGSLRSSNEATVQRRQLREILGGKLARELTFRK